MSADEWRSQGFEQAFASNFGNGVKFLRNANGLGLRDLSDLIKQSTGVVLHFTALSKIETGNRQVTLPEALAIAHALDVDLKDVLNVGRADEAVDVERLREDLHMFEQLAEKLQGDADEYRLAYEQTQDRADAAKRRVRNITSMLARRQGEEKSDG